MRGRRESFPAPRVKRILTQRPTWDIVRVCGLAKPYKTDAPCGQEPRVDGNSMTSSKPGRDGIED